MKKILVGGGDFSWMDDDEVLLAAQGVRRELAPGQPSVQMIITREGELLPAIEVDGVVAILPIDQLGQFIKTLQSVESTMKDLLAGDTRQ